MKIHTEKCLHSLYVHWCMSLNICVQSGRLKNSIFKKKISSKCFNAHHTYRRILYSSRLHTLLSLKFYAFLPSLLLVFKDRIVLLFETIRRSIVCAVQIYAVLMSIHTL